MSDALRQDTVRAPTHPPTPTPLIRWEQANPPPVRQGQVQPKARQPEGPSSQHPQYHDTCLTEQTQSTLEQGKDSLASTADSIAGKAQPESEKSTTQKASDSLSSGTKDAQKQGGSMLDQASEAASNAAKSVQDTLGLGESKLINLGGGCRDTDVLFFLQRNKRSAPSVGMGEVDMMEG
ncbi:chaperone heat shock hsp12 protein [Teratosphaeria destructans]|uniref:Chaperone heat shock hsp12 protein n=1 Tax=Teratosphaeria destructans TaxID=418781 RepID=A0A9W7VYY5_9PEZI|nr:chaperone heat shock hsp12 protein [Teratosphaeria destructans]